MKSRLASTELIVAFAAIFVSTATLFVYIYQTRIMLSQQRASVWPYVEWTYAMRSDQGFSLTVANKGVGPAIVRSAKLTLAGEPIATARDLLGRYVALDSTALVTTTIDDRVIAPGERLTLFHIDVRDRDEYVDLHRKLDPLFQNLEFRICYCSIYGDCWTSTGLEVQAGGCR